MALDLSPYKPVINTANDPDKLASAFTTIENYVNTTLPATVPGATLAYVQFTAPVSITATSEGGAQTVASAGTIVFDGSLVDIEFYCPEVTHSVPGTNVYLVLFDVGTPLGTAAKFGPPTNGDAVHGSRRFAPPAGAHTYKWNALTDVGTATFSAGAGGPTTLFPGYIKITKA